MPTVSPSGGGGGGSVSAPLTLTAPNDLNPVLTLVAAAGTIASGNGILSVVDELGAEEVHLDPDILKLKSSVGAGSMSLSLDQRDAGGFGVVLHSAQGLTVDGGAVRIADAGVHANGIGFIADGPHVAPDSAVMLAGEWTLWLDQTPGSTALKIKAMDSGGTVRTATVPLS